VGMQAGAGLLELIGSNQNQQEPVPFNAVERKLGGHQLQLLQSTAAFGLAQSDLRHAWWYLPFSSRPADQCALVHPVPCRLRGISRRPG